MSFPIAVKCDACGSLKTEGEPCPACAVQELRMIERRRQTRDRQRTRRALGLAPFAHSLWWARTAIDSATESATIALAYSNEASSREIQEVVSSLRDLRRRVAALETA